MIVQAIVIVLVILIVANIGLGFYNQMYPPCFDANEYFNGARKLPDGAIASLGSIPSGNDVKYIGARLVETDKSNVVGLKSWNSIYGENREGTEGMEHPIFEEEEDEHGSTVVREVTRPKHKQMTNDSIDPHSGTIKPGQGDPDDASAYDAVSAMYPTDSQRTSGTMKRHTDIGGKLVSFEEEMQGVNARPRAYQPGNSSNPTQFRNAIERDGYS
jgi:hypothetical protein